MLSLISNQISAQLTKSRVIKDLYHEFHVSVRGNDANIGSANRPLKTIMAAANKAMPGDVITVHAGIYRESIAPPRGGSSDSKRITYQAAKGENVVITGSEPVNGWKKVQNQTWTRTLPNSFFGKTNPFDEQLYGSWYFSKKGTLPKRNHTGSVYLNGKRIRETFSLEEVTKPIGDKPLWYAKAAGNGGPVVMNFEWVCPVGGKQMTSMEASVEGGDQAAWVSITRWPFAYLKDGSVLHFDGVDFRSGTDTLNFQASTFSKGGTVEMHLKDPDGELLGSALVTNTGDWETYAVFKLKMLRKLSGKQDVCLVIRAPALKPNGKTTIWAQFPAGIDPNKKAVEVSVRSQVFYPNKTGVNYITVRGFTLENAATNWAPPSAEQPGLIGPRWAKGWIIEHNVIRNSRCTGISLGRPTFGHAHHYQKLHYKVYPEPNGGQTQQQLMNYYELASWTKEDAGFHIIRNNQIYECGQAGIVGSSGGSFSLIEGNDIHDVCIDETFDGYEQAGIKLHFAIDAVIKNNHIYHANRGLWLDWGAQGVQVIGNLFHDNNATEDVFVEISHGPTFFANNILLSKISFNLNAQGIALVHNFIYGATTGGIDKSGRFSFLYRPHETTSNGKSANPGGDWQWYNNIFTDQATLGKWREAKLPIKYAGNVVAKNANDLLSDSTALVSPNFDSKPCVIQKKDGWYMKFRSSSNWINGQKRKMVTTESLGKAIIPNQGFTKPDGSPLIINYDYFGHKRDPANPYPGPFEQSGDQGLEIKVWPVALLRSQ
ncbi:carbohydrate-binding protein [Mucilaginibacter terrae]|uniref:carbohydrate-binding protein n=1 Tax=Mucilaginibacter terrae TaxID=1955052 RepID=UPI003672DD29